MIITKKHLARRTFLRGLGVTLALPMLDSMVPAFGGVQAQVAQAVRRLSVVYTPNGIFMPNWTPAIQSGDLEITPTLQPLAPFRDRMLMISGLCSEEGIARPGEGAGDHARAAGAFLTGVHPKKTEGLRYQGRHFDGPDRRAGARRADTVGVTRAVVGVGGARRIVRPRVQLRVCEHALLEQRHHAIADGEQPPPRV